MARLLLPQLRSYLVREGLIAGSYPGHPDDEVTRAKLGTLVSYGIHCFVNLMEEDEQHWNGSHIRWYEPILEEFEHGGTLTMKRFPVRDMDIPSVEYMIDILDYIDAMMERGETVYLHCLGGVGRTGTVVGCWLARHGLASGKDILLEISRLREYDPLLDPPSPQTDAQAAMVCAWARGQ